MAWCTKCKKEYSDEFSSCPNCNTNPQSTSALGSELMDSLKPYAFKEDFTMQDLVDDLEDTDGIPKSAKLYKSARDYYADARSTAFAFFLIGFSAFLLFPPSELNTFFNSSSRTVCFT